MDFKNATLATTLSEFFAKSASIYVTIDDIFNNKLVNESGGNKYLLEDYAKKMKSQKGNSVFWKEKCR